MTEEPPQEFSESPKKSSKKKHYAMIFLLALGIILIIAGLIMVLSTKTSDTITGRASDSCPQDYCLGWVYGSCSGPGIRYKERTCFDYPETSNCEQGRRMYYEKSSEPDSACP